MATIQERYSADIEALRGVFNDKLMLMKEQEKQTEFELQVSRKELKTVLENFGGRRSLKDDNTSHLKQEVIRLRKFVSERQQEIQDLRKNTAVFFKKQKEAQVKLETHLRKQYKDNFSAHMKVLELQLSKFVQLS